MKKKLPGASKWIFIVSGILILFGFYLTTLYNYLLFHSIAEVFIVVVACGIFMVAWNSRRFLDNNYLLFVGIAYLFIAVLELIHTLGYVGMGIFKGYGTNLGTQLWIAARYMESLSLLIAPLFFARRIRLNILFVAYASATCLIFLSIFLWNIFPVCFVEGTGLTPFKKISEYIISLILLGSVALLFRSRKEFEVGVYRLLIASILLTIAAELTFTFYIHAYGFSNLVGHYFTIISFYLIYKAIIETGLVRPYDLLFRNLKKSEEALRISEERYKTMFDNIMNGVAIYRAENDGEDFVFVDFNKYAESIDNVKKDDLVGKSVLKMFPSIKDFGLFDVFKRVWKTGRPEEHPVALYKDERISVWRDNFVYRLPSGEIVSVYNDVTSRKQAEEELERSQDQLRSFTDHIQDIREDERANIAHEIHDEMGQALTGLNMDLSWLAKKVPGDREELLEKIRAMSGLVSAIHKNRTADHRGSETGAPG